MESSDMKNMVVLKNLPSNIVEEAIVIFKENQKVRERELVDKGSEGDFSSIEHKDKELVLKEAEMLVTDYINRIEQKNNLTRKNSNNNIMTKYKILKLYSITSTVLLIISLIINFI